MRGRSVHVCVGDSAAFKADLLDEARARATTWWTIRRAARPRDGALFYLTAPDSALLVRGTVLSRPELDEDPHSEWRGSYFAEIGELEIFAYPVTRKALLAEFPGWGFWRWPQSAARVPDAYSARAWELFDRPSLGDLQAEALGESLPRCASMSYSSRRVFRDAMAEVERGRGRYVAELARAARVTEAAALLSVHECARRLRVTFDVALDGLHAYHRTFPAGASPAPA